MMKNHRQAGLEQGRKAAERAGNLQQQMTETIQQWQRLYPTAAGLDFSAIIRDLDQRRLQEEPDLQTFPELRGHSDFLLGEREGFREVSGADATATAFFYSSAYFEQRPLNAKHLARWDLVTAPDVACTNIFFPEGAEGVTIADNRDITLPAKDLSWIRNWRPDGLLASNHPTIHWHQGGVSAAVLLDDEPACSFPANPFQYGHLIPKECFDNIDAFIEFLTRYNEFWGPGNKILVDRKLQAVAVEKTNCLIAFHRPTVNGAVAVTACAYLDETLSSHQLERAARAAALKGETIQTNPDYNYHLGSRARYLRLLELTNRAAANRPTIWDALDIVADHAVPYPERICLAGESFTHPSDRPNPNENWSALQHAAVLSGPNRRVLYRSVQDRETLRPVYDYKPRLLLEPGASLSPDCQAEIAAGRCLPPLNIS